MGRCKKSKKKDKNNTTRILGFVGVFFVIALLFAMILESGCKLAKTGKAVTFQEGQKATISAWLVLFKQDPSGYKPVVSIEAANLDANNKYTTEISNLVGGLGKIFAVKPSEAIAAPEDHKFIIVVGSFPEFSSDPELKSMFYQGFSGEELNSWPHKDGAVVKVVSDSSSVKVFVLGLTSGDSARAINYLKSAFDSPNPAFDYSEVLIDASGIHAVLPKTCTVTTDSSGKKVVKYTLGGAGPFKEYYDKCENNNIYIFSCDDKNNLVESKQTCDYGCYSDKLTCKQIDLAVKSIEVSPAVLKEKTPYEVIVVLENKGDGAFIPKSEADSDKVAFSVDVTGGTQNTGKTVTGFWGPVGAGETKEFRMAITDTPELISAGSKKVTVSVDTKGIVPESSEGNNIAERAFEVSACVPQWLCCDKESGADQQCLDKIAVGELNANKFWGKCDMTNKIQTRYCFDREKCGADKSKPSTVLDSRKCCDKCIEARCGTDQICTDSDSSYGNTCLAIPQPKCPEDEKVIYKLVSNAIGAKILVDNKDTGLVVASGGVSVTVSKNAVELSLQTDDYDAVSTNFAAWVGKNTITLNSKPKVSTLLISLKETKNLDKYTLVIGNSVEDNIAAIAFASSTGVSTVKTHKEITGICNDNLIVIGGPCANDLAKSLLKPQIIANVCYDNPLIGKGMTGRAVIKVFGPTDLNALGCTNSQNTVVLLAGSTAEDTRRAANSVWKFLSNKDKYKPKIYSTEAVISGQGLEDGLEEDWDVVKDNCIDPRTKEKIKIGACSGNLLCGKDQGKNKLIDCTKLNQVCVGGDVGCKAAAVTPTTPLTAKILSPEDSASISINEPVQFKAEASGGLPSKTGYTFNWNFGDGKGTSSEQNPKYTFTTAKKFTVKLNVIDSQGKIATANIKVYVSDI